MWDLTYENPQKDGAYVENAAKCLATSHFKQQMWDSISENRQKDGEDLANEAQCFGTCIFPFKCGAAGAQITPKHENKN